MRLHFTPVRRATTETTVGMGVEKPERLTLGGRNTTSAAIVGYHGGSSIKRNYQMISKSTVECIHGRSEISKGCLYTCSRQCHSGVRSNPCAHWPMSTCTSVVFMYKGVLLCLKKEESHDTCI